MGPEMLTGVPHGVELGLESSLAYPGGFGRVQPFWPLRYFYRLRLMAPWVDRRQLSRPATALGFLANPSEAVLKFDGT
jgi:hypothetical protein